MSKLRTSLPAEVRSLLQETVAADSVLQVGIHLHLLGEVRGLYLNEGGGDGLHVAPGVAEGDSAGPDGILVPVSVYAGVHDSSEQIMEDVGETLGIQGPMQSPDKDRLLGVQPLTGTSDVVTVSQHPGDDLNLLAPHPPARDLEVPGGVAVRALGEKERNMFLVIKHDVDVTLRGRGGTVLARPLNPGDERRVRERSEREIIHLI